MFPHRFEELKNDNFDDVINQSYGKPATSFPQPGFGFNSLYGEEYDSPFGPSKSTSNSFGIASSSVSNGSWNQVSSNYGTVSTGIDDNILCSCGILCVLRTSRQEHSFGNRFYCYAKQEADGRCNFFQWYDNAPNHSSIMSGLSTPIKDPQFELKHRFGHKEFRQGQQSCVDAALKGRDVFCLMPTGGGKSIVYQVRYHHPHLLPTTQMYAVRFLRGVVLV